MALHPQRSSSALISHPEKIQIQSLLIFKEEKVLLLKYKYLFPLGFNAPNLVRMSKGRPNVKTLARRTISKGIHLKSVPLGNRFFSGKNSSL